MLLLTATNDIIELVSSAAATLDVHASFLDASQADPPVVQATSGRQNTAITTATTTTIVAAPASTETRNVTTIHVRNKHASLACDVTIQFDAAGTNYELFKTTLNPGDCLQYVEGLGFTRISAFAGLMMNRVVTADAINATTSFADITGLTVPVVSGRKYCFEAHLHHIENANTTGARFGINGPTSTLTRVGGFGMYTGSLTAAVMFGQLADITAYDTAVPGATTASTTTPQVALYILSGYVNPSADGTLAMRFQSEVAVAAGVTVKAGSWLQCWEVQ